MAIGVALQFKNSKNKMSKFRRQYYLIFIRLETFAATEFNEIPSGRRPEVDAALCPRKFNCLTFDNMFKMHGTITYLNSLIFFIVCIEMLYTLISGTGSVPVLRLGFS